MKSSTALNSSSKLFLCRDYPQRQLPCQLGGYSRPVLPYYVTVRVNTVWWGTLRRQQSTQLISVCLLLLLTLMWLVYKLSFRVEMRMQGRQYVSMVPTVANAYSVPPDILEHPSLWGGLLHYFPEVKWPLPYFPLPLRKGFPITQTNLKLLILQPQPLKCWDDRPATSCHDIPHVMLHS